MNIQKKFSNGYVCDWTLSQQKIFFKSKWASSTKCDKNLQLANQVRDHRQVRDRRLNSLLPKIRKCDDQHKIL